MEGASSGRTKRRSRKKDFSTALEMTKRSTQHQEASDTKMPFHNPKRSRPPIRNPGSATFHCIGRLFRSRPFWQSVWGGLKRAAGAPADFDFHRPRAFLTPCEHDERRMTPEPPPPARPPRAYSLLHQQLKVLRLENKGLGQAGGTAGETATEHFDSDIQARLERCFG